MVSLLPRTLTDKYSVPIPLDASPDKRFNRKESLFDLNGEEKNIIRKLPAFVGLVLMQMVEEIAVKFLRGHFAVAMQKILNTAGSIGDALGIHCLDDSVREKEDAVFF